MVSDPKLTFLPIYANFRTFKLLVETEDTLATQRFFVKLLLMVKYTLSKEWRCRMSDSMFYLIKTSILGAIFHKIRLFWVKTSLFDAKTDPFIPFGVNSFKYLEHIGTNNRKKTNW